MKFHIINIQTAMNSSMSFIPKLKLDHAPYAEEML